jgi:hypothetical protein
MEPNYEIALSGAKTDEARLKTLTKENVDLVISKREEIIRGYAIKRPRKTLSYAISETKKHIVEILTGAGVSIQEEDIPDLVLIDWGDKEKLEQALGPLGGVGSETYKEDRGNADVLNGVSMVFVRDDITDLGQAGIIFHEKYHSTGRRVIVANERVAKPGRQGFEIFSKRPQYKSWLLEEGLVVYESVKFMEKLSSHEMFRDDVLKKERIMRVLQAKGTIVDGKVRFNSGMEIEPDFCFLLSRGRLIKRTGLGPPGHSGIAGSLFELLLTKFEGDEQKEFLNLARRARRNFKLIPQMARSLDEKWGKGTYSKLLKCERTEEAVWGLIQSFRTVLAKNG